MNNCLHNSAFLQTMNKNKKNQKGIQLRKHYAYELHMERFKGKNPFEEEQEEMNVFMLSTLREIISVVEERLKRGVKTPIIFYSKKHIIMADNLTVSLTEYMVYYYHMVENLDIYITQGILTKNEFSICTLQERPFYHNGFFCGSIMESFMVTSFLLGWYPTDAGKIDDNELKDAFFLKNINGRRFKAIVGQGPWDASISISECQLFLQNQGVTLQGIDAVMDVIGELVPNAIEHGETNCLLDVSCEKAEYIENERLVGGITVSVVVLDFSDKLLWTALKKKIFVDADKQGYINKIERINTVKEAWKNHEIKFSDIYGEHDFYNVMAFQKISGREGDRIDGGLGISTLIKRVQEYTRNDFCYVLSGNGALRLDTEFTESDMDGYIGFNMKRNFINAIPDESAVMKTKFYMPGVAYNLCFNFMEDE